MLAVRADEFIGMLVGDDRGDAGNGDYRERRREPDETISHRGSHGVRALLIPVNMGRASIAGPSQPSHRLVRRHRTRASWLDTRWTLTCVNGFRRTGRTSGTGLRIRRLGGRVPLSVPQFP